MRAPTLFSYLSLEQGEAICKLAEPKKPSRALEVAKAIGIPLAGYGIGGVTGFAAGQLADTISQKLLGRPIPQPYLDAIAPAFGAGLSLTYSMYKAHEREDLRRAFEGHPDRSTTRR